MKKISLHGLLISKKHMAEFRRDKLWKVLQEHGNDGQFLRAISHSTTDPRFVFE